MSIEAMKQWAEGVSKAYDLTAWGHTERAAEILRQTRDTLRTAIEQAEKQEPVAWMHTGGHVQVRNPTWADGIADGYTRDKGWTPLYTTPPAAPVQDDIADFIAGAFGVSRGTAYDMMREALKEAAPVQEPVALKPEDVIVETYAIQQGGFMLKPANGVRLIHKPTGTVVQCDSERSQHRNRDTAWRDLEKHLAATTPPAAQPAPVQEPVAWQVHPFDYGIGHEGVYARTDRPEQVEMWKRKGWTVQPLYTTPPAAQRQRVSLTDEQINELRQQYGVTSDGRGIKEFTYVCDFVRAIEAAHGITEQKGGAA